MGKYRNNLLSHPVRTSDLSFDDLYEEISRDVELRAQELQQRRWERIAKQESNF